MNNDMINGQNKSFSASALLTSEQFNEIVKREGFELLVEKITSYKEFTGNEVKIYVSSTGNKFAYKQPLYDQVIIFDSEQDFNAFYEDELASYVVQNEHSILFKLINSTSFFLERNEELLGYLSTQLGLDITDLDYSYASLHTISRKVTHLKSKSRNIAGNKKVLRALVYYIGNVRPELTENMVFSVKYRTYWPDSNAESIDSFNHWIGFTVDFLSADSYFTSISDYVQE